MAQKAQLYKDGNMWCATEPGFKNLQESTAGFGETQESAVADLNRNLRMQHWRQNKPSFELSDFEVI